MLARFRESVRTFLQAEQIETISATQLNQLLDAEEAKERRTERSPWLAFEAGDGGVLIVPEPWRNQPLPNGGYVELRYSVDGATLGGLWGRAVWPKGIPVE